MRATSNVALGAGSPNSTVWASSPSAYSSGLQGASFSSDHQHRNAEDFFFRAYGPKHDTSSIGVPSAAPAISTTTKSQRSTSTDTDADNNLCFPQRLFRMLNKIDDKFEHLSHIVSWHESGMGFLIHKPDSFVKQVMPIFFRSQTKLTSFQRQLNNYGFQRIQERKNIESLTYYHKHFLRDDPAECRNVELKRCNKISSSKSTGVKSSASIFNKTKQVKEERLSLLLKIIPKLCSSSSSASSYAVPSKNIKNAFAQQSAMTATPPNITSALSLFALLDEGDKILDEAAGEIYYNSSHEAIQEEQVFATTKGFNSSYAASFWDPDIEALDSVEGI